MMLLLKTVPIAPPCLPTIFFFFFKEVWFLHNSRNCREDFRTDLSPR